jgi:hypothetical protein
MLDRPIFISGLRKSGTSMVRQLLDGHPDLFVLPINELHFFEFTPFVGSLRGSRNAQIERASRIHTPEEGAVAAAQFKFLSREHSPNSPVNFEAIQKDILDRHPQTWAELYECIVRSIAQHSPTGSELRQDTRFAAKGVQQEDFLIEFLQMFPDLKFIYVLRNPYGQFNAAINQIRYSLVKSEKQSEIGRDIDKLNKIAPYPYLGQRLKQMSTSYFFMRKWVQLFPENFYIFVYDRLLENEQAEIESLCDFLEISYHDSLHQTTQLGKEARRQGWSAGGQRDNSAIDRAGLDAWMDQMPPGAIRLITKTFPDVLDEFGFERATSARRDLSLRIHPKESIKDAAANRWLFTNQAQQLL